MPKYSPQRLFEMMNRVGGMPLTEVDGETDISTQRKDVLRTFFLQH